MIFVVSEEEEGEEESEVGVGTALVAAAFDSAVSFEAEAEAEAESVCGTASLLLLCSLLLCFFSSICVCALLPTTLGRLTLVCAVLPCTASSGGCRDCNNKEW